MCYNGSSEINPPYIPTVMALREAGIDDVKKIPREERFAELMAAIEREAHVQASRDQIRIVTSA